MVEEDDRCRLARIFFDELEETQSDLFMPGLVISPEERGRCRGWAEAIGWMLGHIVEGKSLDSLECPPEGGLKYIKLAYQAGRERGRKETGRDQAKS